MSTTFDVFPKLSKITSFRDLLDLSTARLSEYLIDHGINAQPTINVALQSNRNHKPRPFDLNSPAVWRDSEYAWFYIESAPGGTDAYFCSNQEIDYEIWDEEINANSRAAEKKTLINECLANGHHWYFRRSAGQPGIINLAYGMIAGSLAELTEGFIYSDDSAWDYERFPATAQEFFSWYLRPDKAIKTEYAEWAARCIKWIVEELKA
jgi:hypothetical protein